MSNQSFVVSRATLTSIAAAIRAAGGTSAPLEFPAEWIDALEDINNVELVPLNVTANGTYTAPSGQAYSPVTVNVDAAGQIATGSVTPSNNGYTLEITCGFRPKLVAFFPNDNSTGYLSGVIAGFWTTSMGNKSAGIRAAGPAHASAIDLIQDNTVQGYYFSVSDTGIVFPSVRYGNYTAMYRTNFFWIAATW